MSDKRRQEAFFTVLVAAAWAEGPPDDRVLSLLLEYAELLELGRPTDERLVAQLRQPPDGAQGLASLSEQLAALPAPEELAVLLAAVEGLLLADGTLSSRELGFLSDLWALTETRRAPAPLVQALQRSWQIAAPLSSPPADSGRLSFAPGELVRGLLVGEILRRPGSARDADKP